MSISIWFIADTHFGHANILKYCNRPFSSIRQHDDWLIDNWNSCIKKDDVVYHLGDFGLAGVGYLLKVRHILNGRVHIILGNHDKAIKGALADTFETISLYKELRVPDLEMDTICPIMLMHYPIESWNKKHWGAWHLHGHCHGNIPTPPGVARLDVGVDSNNYYPVSYEAVKARFTQQMMGDK